VSHVLLRCWFDPVVDKQAVKILAAGLVIANPDSGRNAGSGEVGSESHLHVKQRVKLAPRHLSAKLSVAFATGLFVENNEFNAGQIANQLGFDLADNPGDLHAGKLLLEAQHDRYYVSHVADGGQAKNADGVHQILIRFRLWPGAVELCRQSLVNWPPF